MLGKKLVIFFVTILVGLSLGAQKRIWGNLEISVSEGWSAIQKAGFVQYSNYNLANAEPFTITLFDNQPYDGKADTLFAYAWKKYITEPPLPKEIPRWRRFYTEEGLLIQQGFVEFTNEGGTLYRQLNVFLLNQTIQACILETTSQKNYRILQTEWMENLQGVRQINTGKK